MNERRRDNTARDGIVVVLVNLAHRLIRPRSALIHSFTRRFGVLDSAQQDQNQYDDENQANTAGRIVAPLAAVRPSRKGAQHSQYQNDQ
jgi:hypothetical protein